MRCKTLILLGCSASILCWFSLPLRASTTKLSAGGSSSRLSFETTRRLALTYFYVEMHWVFGGSYPDTLRQLVQSSPRFPLGPLSPEVIVDPYSAYEIPLRYRVTDKGPEIAGIGPDGRWGGWQDHSPSFFGTDDVRIDRASAPVFLQRYMHATYCCGLLEDRIPLLGIQIDGRWHHNKEIARRMSDRKPSAELQATDPDGFLQQMKAKLDVKVIKDIPTQDPAAITQRVHTGMDSWLPKGPRLQGVRCSLWEAFLILQESTSAVLAVDLWGRQTAILKAYLPEEGDYLAYVALLTQAKFDDMRWFLMEEHAVRDISVIVFPRQWFDEDGIARLRQAVARLVPSKVLTVRETEGGVVIAGFPSYEYRFFFADNLMRFVSREERVDR